MVSHSGDDSDLSDHEGYQSAGDAKAQLTVAHVSLKSVIGQPSRCRTLQMKGSIQGHKVNVLIDSGATNNFICQDVVHELNVPLEDTAPYVIHLGDSRRTLGQHIVRHVGVLVQGYEVTADFLPVPSLCIDVILSLAWLSTLCWTWSHWDLLVLPFQVNTLDGESRGQPPAHPHHVSMWKI